MSRNHNSYPLESSPLYKLKGYKSLEKLINIPHDLLITVDSIISYSTFFEKKKDGSLREITAPNETLKKIQSSILKLLNRINKPEWLISSVKGKSYVSNARMHLGNPYLITADIKHFYDNCSSLAVFHLFRDGFSMSKDLATVLTKLVTLDGRVPTGAPTSQLICFFAYENMFIKINEIAKNYNCAFSLYVDDMTFSSPNSISAKMIYEINFTLKAYGHLLKNKKIRYFYPSSTKIITGVILTPGFQLKVPNSIRHQIVKDRRVLEQEKKNLNKRDMNKLIKRIRGRIQCSRNIEPTIFRETERSINTLDV